VPTLKKASTKKDRKTKLQRGRGCKGCQVRSRTRRGRTEDKTVERGKTTTPKDQRIRCVNCTCRVEHSGELKQSAEAGGKTEHLRMSHKKRNNKIAKRHRRKRPRAVTLPLSLCASNHDFRGGDTCGGCQQGVSVTETIVPLDTRRSNRGAPSVGKN